MSYRVYCQYCSSLLTTKATSIHLISSPNSKGYSCQDQPFNVQQSGRVREFGLCKCQVRDLICMDCKQVCGHHVVAGCQKCLSAKNNGHYWIIMTGIGKTLQKIYLDHLSTKRQ